MSDFRVEYGNVRGSDVFPINVSIASDHKRDRQTENSAVKLSDLRATHDDRVVHPELLRKGLHWIDAVVHRHADDLQSLVPVLLLKLNEVGNFVAAGIAPGRPEIKEHNFSTIRRKLKRLAIDLGQREVRRNWQSFRVPSTVLSEIEEATDCNGGKRKGRRPLCFGVQNYSPLAVGYPLFTQSVPKLSGIYSTFTFENPMDVSASKAGFTFGQWPQGQHPQ